MERKNGEKHLKKQIEGKKWRERVGEKNLGEKKKERKIEGKH